MVQWPGNKKARKIRAYSSPKHHSTPQVACHEPLDSARDKPLGVARDKQSGESSHRKAFPARRMVELKGFEPSTS